MATGPGTHDGCRRPGGALAALRLSRVGALAARCSAPGRPGRGALLGGRVLAPLRACADKPRWAGWAAALSSAPAGPVTRGPYGQAAWKKLRRKPR
jgi:hypothetical protein